MRHLQRTRWLTCALLLAMALGRPAAAETRRASPRPQADHHTLADVQKCLDEKRKNNWEKRQRNEQAAKEKSGTGAYTFHKVSESELPATNFKGDIHDFRQALQYQLQACDSVPEKKITDRIGGECKRNPDAPFCKEGPDREKEIAKRRKELAAKYNASTTSKFGCREVTRAEWCTQTNRRMLELAEQSSDLPALFAKLREEFDWYKSDGALADDKNGVFKKGDVQFTAYYVPAPIEARLKPTGPFKYPIYRKPKSIVQANPAIGITCGEDPLTRQPLKWCMKQPDGKSYRPAPDRKAIDLGNALKDKSLVIAYVKDRYDIANLMLQGSGSISVPGPDGPKIIRLNYDGNNGRTRYMLANVVECDGGSAEDWNSLDAIREYLNAHSDRKEALMALDSSYVFYKTSGSKPMGSAGVPVTARHSFATDNEVLPKGTVSWFHVNGTDADSSKRKAACPDLSSIAIAQDSGGAIHGTHVDYYMGEGDEAKSNASSFNCPGSLFVALPKRAGRPIANCSEN